MKMTAEFTFEEADYEKIAGIVMNIDEARVKNMMTATDITPPERERLSESKEEKKKEIELSDLQKAASELIQNDKANEVKKILASFGVKKVTEIPETEYETALKMLKDG